MPGAALSDITVRANAGEPLDALLWRAAGLGVAALAPVIAANPSLAGAGVFLDQGAAVVIPASASAPAASPLVQLWD